MPDDKTAKTSLDFLKKFLTAVKGEGVVFAGLISQARREDSHTTIADLTPPCIQIDGLMEVWKTTLFEYNDEDLHKIDDSNIEFRKSEEIDNIGTHMGWKRNCNIPDKVRQDYTLVVESVWFGDGHAAELYNSGKMEKEDNESNVVTDAKNKMDKYLVKVFRKF